MLTPGGRSIVCWRPSAPRICPGTSVTHAKLPPLTISSTCSEMASSRSPTGAPGSTASVAVNRCTRLLLALAADSVDLRPIEMALITEPDAATCTVAGLYSEPVLPFTYERKLESIVRWKLQRREPKTCR